MNIKEYENKLKKAISLIDVKFAQEITDKKDIAIINEGVIDNINNINKLTTGFIHITIYTPNNDIVYENTSMMFTRYDYKDNTYTINDIIYNSDIINKYYKEESIKLLEPVKYLDKYKQEQTANNDELIKIVHNIYDITVFKYIRDNMHYLTDNRWNYVITNTGIG